MMLDLPVQEPQAWYDTTLGVMAMITGILSGVGIIVAVVARFIRPALRQEAQEVTKEIQREIIDRLTIMEEFEQHRWDELAERLDRMEGRK